ncbi:MAG TPA: VWA domain-containing protein [Pirellulales bacterium]|nr:VWA domain-containing protein [Pirellulales bacterium]
MSDFRFADPNWSHALWLVAAVAAILFWLDRRRDEVLGRFLSATMQTRLAHRMSRGRRWSSIVCLALAGVCLIVTLMRPQWGLSYQETPRVGAQLMFCLDVSKSMLAEDSAPNRLDRAKAELTDLLSYLDGDQVGLIAFAGRATVLCPLTPDFGFFKLILDGAGPHSVGRGGTRLEEPIRKALAGFRTESDVSRVLVLITDGEDHESHPLDAAKAAAERGVKILAIGFGDEAGSEIFVTDQQTGARTQLRDGDGRPVVTRLDGDTLREMALTTDGAYIPAGTGALDLKSIYDAHIAPLVRGQLDDRGHAVRRDAFQWTVLAGFAFLVASILVGSGSVRSELQSWGAEREVRSFNGAAGEMPSGTKESVPPRTAAVVGAVLLVFVLGPLWNSVHAQATPGESAAITADGVQPASPAGSEKAGQASGTSPTDHVDPRASYNDALAYLDNDFDRAERMLSEARREAAADGDVRFRATYNLGWVEVQRADKLSGEQAQEALVHLRRAADWFRDAVRLRPDHSDARHNLEVVLRRIVLLADSLARRDERDLAKRLDELVEAQRRIVSTARQIVDRIAGDSDPNAADALRGEFRQIAVEQRKVLSDSQALSRDAREELEALGAKPDKEQSPQDKLRAAQLTSLLDYANRADQRLGQARGQMRRREAKRSFRRAAAGLTELKRARDQLRGPVEVLDVILADAALLLQLTTVKAKENNLSARIAPSEPAGDEGEPAAPTDAVESGKNARALPWLTREYLEEDQVSLCERTDELTTRLKAATEQPQSPASANKQGAQPANSTADEETTESAASDRFLEMVRDALPFLEQGQAAFQTASQSLSADRLDDAADSQLKGITALRAARERFLDLRGLVELAYARQTDIQRLLPGSDENDAQEREPESEQNTPTADSSPSQENSERTATRGTEDARAEETALRMQLAAQLQSENIGRGERLEKLIETEAAALPPAAEGDPKPNASQPADPAAQKAKAQREQLQLAGTLLQLARDEMSQAQTVMAQAAKSEPTHDSDPQPDAVNDARKHADGAAEHLQALRRLFFSIAEHLRETAQRQAELNDETEQAAALAEPDDAAKKAEPLTHRQRELESTSRRIAEALREQAHSPPTHDEQQAADPKQLEQLKAIAEQYAKAGKLVAEGEEEMAHAAEQLSDVSPAGEADASVAINATSGDSPSKGDQTEETPDDRSTSRRSLPFDAARKHQNTALQKLLEALALLQPPQPEQQQGQQDQKPQDQNSGEPDAGKQDKPDDRAGGPDPARLLQAVRDREAQRRRDRERRGRFEHEPVDKDW